MLVPRTLLTCMVLLVFLASSNAAPHIGMISTAQVEEVGVIFSGPNFTGDALSLVASKSEPICESLPNVDGGVSSIQICKDNTVCNFFKSSDCTDIWDGYSVRCGDVPSLDDSLSQPKYYMCGLETPAVGPAVEPLPTVVPSEPHDEEAGKDALVGRE